jgi:hypothetical protein
MEINSIAIYNTKETNYTQNLNKIINNIRLLSGMDVKYRSSFDKKLTKLQSSYLDRGK